MLWACVCGPFHPVEGLQSSPSLLATKLRSKLLYNPAEEVLGLAKKKEFMS